MRRSGIDILGVLFGLIALGIVLFAGITLFSGGGFTDRWSPFTGDFRGFRPGGRVEESGEETIEGNFETIELQNIAGSVTVHGWDRDYVRVEYVKSAPTRRFLDDLYVGIESNGGVLEISRESRKMSPTMRGTISFEMWIPATAAELRIQSVSGKIELEGMSDTVDLDLATTSGRILTDNGGNFRAKSISGRIEFVSHGDEVDIRTTSGRIEGTLREMGPEGRIEIRSVSGSVRIAVPADFGAQVDIRSVSGAVTTDIPVEVFSSKRNSLEGTIGGGGAEVDISTTSGSIRIQEL
ncbi:MAG: DUF4097 family beta strand repeat-containing protein [Spirochaetia bacterium]